jgi:hypothetical protein
MGHFALKDVLPYPLVDCPMDFNQLTHQNQLFKKSFQKHFASQNNYRNIALL